MNSGETSDERSALMRVRERYVRMGYAFEEHPQPSSVPSFLEGYIPDAIARKGDGGVIIEVKGNKTAAEQSAIVSFLNREVAKHPGWNFDLVLLDELSSDRVSDRLPTVKELRDELEDVKQLVRQDNKKVAILYGWSLLEGAVKLLPVFDQVSSRKRYLPSTIVETLASEGLVNRDAEEILFRASRIRTALAHGMIAQEVPMNVMVTLLATIEQVLVEVETNGISENMYK